MKTKHLLITSLTAIGLATGSSSALAAGFVIDTFDLPPSLTVPPPGNPPGYPPLTLTTLNQTATQIFPMPGDPPLDNTETIGGTRQFTYTLTEVMGVAPRATGQLLTGSGNFDGFLDLENNTRASSRAELFYGDLNAPGMDQGNFAVLGGANEKKGIAIDFMADASRFDLTLEIGDGMGNVAVVNELDCGNGILVSDCDFEQVTTGTARFTFAQILSNAPSGFDLSNVNYVKLIVTGDLGYDLSISQIDSFEVPEPSTILGLLAFLGTGAFSLKRNKK